MTADQTQDAKLESNLKVNSIFAVAIVAGMAILSILFSIPYLGSAEQNMQTHSESGTRRQVPAAQTDSPNR